MSDDKKIIFSMTGVSKTFPGANTPVLKNIYLSFFYGAKIGILGLNGSGKSTLLKIIAGIDKNYQGDVTPDKEFSVGYLEQEPQLNPEKTVKEMKKEKWSKSALEDLSIVMSDASICGLGQAACNPLNSILKYFPEELQLND